MSELSALTQDSTGFRQELERILAEPEPTCLGVIRVNPAADLDLDPAHYEALMTEALDAVHTRLADVVRPYDRLVRLDGESFAAVMRTLADAQQLRARVASIHTRLTAPYTVSGSQVMVPILFVAAIRVPLEDAASLIGRAEQALAAAKLDDASRPILV